jgi:homocysteine S-methyltransferase
MAEKLFEPFLSKCGALILDGALATELEKRGADLKHSLWSARLLEENPSLIQEVHLDYLKAGADIITTSGYQASYEGFARQGYCREKSTKLLMLSSTLAVQAREQAMNKGLINGPAPLVAASIGPYGASQADGSEYRGGYGLSVEELMQFHRDRMKVLSESGADLLACETIPCPEEAIALIRLLKEFPGVKAWISFSCKNEKEVCDGSGFAECASLANESEQVIAVGINCTDPRYVTALIHKGIEASSKPVIVYPNRGDRWDAVNKCWIPGNNISDFTAFALEWFRAGAKIIGGCCRTSPEDISKIKQAICNQ